MEQEQLDQLREQCQPLKEELGPYLKAIWVYGSATRKDHVEGSDIDILILLDDTKDDFSKQHIKTAKQILSSISDQSDLDLHFQPPKLLSQWWDLIISGEPWAVTSMEDAQPLYDQGGYIALTRKLLREGQMHGTEQRAHRLLKRSRNKLKKVRKLLLEDVTAELLKAMTEAGQAVLMYYGNPPPRPDKIGDRLEENFVEDNLLDPDTVQEYREFYTLTERVDHGQLTEFTGKELDRYIDEALDFIKSMADLFDRLEQQKQQNIVEDSHEELVQVCREALEEKGVDIPTSDKEVLQKFKETFIDKGYVSDEHWEAIQEIEDVKEAADQGRLGQLSEEEIYSSRLHLRDLESAVSGLLSSHHEPEPIEARDDIEDDFASVKAVKEYTDRLLEEHEDEIRATWLLSSEDLKTTNDVTVVILFDDLESSGDRDSVERLARQLNREIKDEKGIDIHPSFYNLTDYWNLVRHGSPVTFTEIREGIPVYDPTGFYLPLKKLLKSGKIPGTKEAMRSLIAKAPKRLAKIKNKYKAQIMEQLYNAVVDAGQAALIVNGVSPPVQKRIPSELRNHLVDQGAMSENDVAKAENIITFWKDYEHGDIKHISGDDLDNAMQWTERFIEATEEILENG